MGVEISLHRLLCIRSFKEIDGGWIDHVSLGKGGLGLFDWLLYLGLRLFLSSVVVIFIYVHLFTSH